jgi:hypothetical protein
VSFHLAQTALASLTVDPSFGTAALILAPVNALMYCGAAVVIGLFTVARRSN